MPRKNDSWGIEIGANAIKGMRLVRNGSQIELAEYDILPFKQILTHTQSKIRTMSRNLYYTALWPLKL